MDQEDELTPAETRLGKLVRAEIERVQPAIVNLVAAAVVEAVTKHNHNLDAAQLALEAKGVAHDDALANLTARVALLERHAPTMPAPPPEAA